MSANDKGLAEEIEHDASGTLWSLGRRYLRERQAELMVKLRKETEVAEVYRLQGRLEMLEEVTDLPNLLLREAGVGEGG